MRLILLVPCLLMLAIPAWADARLTVLMDVMKLREVTQILRDEGISYAAELNDDMLAGQGGPGWQLQLDAIYNTERMLEAMRRALADELESEEIEQAITFFGSDLGQRVITLENTARIAFSDSEIEEAARARYIELSDTTNPRLETIIELARTGDMINRNVTAALNSNYQFMRGLADGDALDMDDDQMLADVTGEMDEITDDTTSWLYGFFLMAYHPLSDEELQTYLTFWQTPAGTALNKAIFDGHGASFEDISYGLGRAIALNMTAQDL